VAAALAMGDLPVRVVAEVQGASGAQEAPEIALGEGGPGYCFGGSCRLMVGCSGYTLCHLPVRSCAPPEFKNADAMRAILAARMAFSNLSTRFGLR